MKKIQMCLVALLLMLPSCKEQPVDIEQEKNAIKEVIAKETRAWINQDLVKILETMVQDEHSMRITIGHSGYKELVGWDRIYSFYKKGMETDWSDYENLTFEHTNFNMDVCQETAMALFDQKWSFTYDGEPQETHSKELRVMKKVNGEWKIQLLQWIDLTSYEDAKESEKDTE
jgi:hypothetical protein